MVSGLGPQPWGSSALPVCHPHPEAVRGRERAALAQVEPRAQAPSRHTAAWAEPRPWDRPPPRVPLWVSCQPAPRPERAWLGEGAASADQGQGLPGLLPGWTPGWIQSSSHCSALWVQPQPRGPPFPARTRGPPASPAAQRLPCPHPSPAHLSSEQPQHPGRADAGWGLTALGSPRLSLPVRPSTCRVSLTRKAHLPPALPSSRAVATVTPVTGSSWFPVSTQPRLQF